MPQVLSFVQSMHRDGKIVAAFCHGPWILISAGLVEGKTITGYVGIKDDITNAGATYVDEAVVVDGNIITSRHPRDIGRFMKELLRLLGLLTISISPCAVEPLRRYDMNPRHPNPEKMPNPSNVGRRIRTDDGREGVIRNEWVDGDDCSGSFGYLKYSFDGSMNNSMSPNAHNCVFLD
jgi:protease I